MVLSLPKRLLRVPLHTLLAFAALGLTWVTTQLSPPRDHHPGSSLPQQMLHSCLLHFYIRRLFCASVICGVGGGSIVVAASTNTFFPAKFRVCEFLEVILFRTRFFRLRLEGFVKSGL